MRFVAGVAVVDEVVVCVMAADVMLMDVTVTVVVSLALGEVEPDVRLKMTLPAARGNGAILPFVLREHVLCELSDPQQKDEPSWAVCITTPWLVLT